MMRIILALLLVALTSANFSAKAQSNEECLQTLSIFSEQAKIKNYDAASEPFKKLRENCPGYHYALYQYGEKLMDDRLEKASDEEKAAVLEDYKTFLGEKKTNFPDKTKEGDDLSYIAYLMGKYDIGTLEEQYAAFNKAWEVDAKTFNNPRTLYAYFSLAIDLYKAEKIELQEVFDLYDKVQSKITSAQNSSAKRLSDIITKQEDGEALNAQEKRTMAVGENNLKAYSQVSSYVDSKLSKVADCDRLVPFYQKEFEGQKNNVDWVKSAAGRLVSKDCKDDPFFVTLVEQLNTLEPSPESSYYLGQLALKQGNTAKATEYFTASAESQTDPVQKAKVYNALGDILKGKGRLSGARSNYLKAVEAQPSYARVYLKIAEMYANSANSCGNDEFEKRAVYWKAAEMADRAGRIDPSLSKAAREQAAYYRGLAPSKTMIFNSNKQGQRITFSCWIGGSVVVPSL